MKLKKKCLFLSTHSPFHDKIKAASVGLTKVNFKVMSGLFCTETLCSLPETTTLVHKGGIHLSRDTVSPQLLTAMA